jgi:hypothetical protein
MAEGEEVFAGYVRPSRSFESRHTALLRNWYFDCDCSLCQADKTPGDRHQDRANLMTHQWPALEAQAKSHTGSTSLANTRPVIARITAFASQIDATYARGRSAKLELSLVVFVLAKLWEPPDTTQALDVSQQATRIQG